MPKHVADLKGMAEVKKDGCWMDDYMVAGGNKKLLIVHSLMLIQVVFL
jgi:hypothetical protein